MATSAKDLFQAALTLSEPDRAELIAMLLDSMDQEQEDGVEAAWLTEVERRMQELDSGAVKPIPWSEVHAKLHRDFDA